MHFDTDHVRVLAPMRPDDWPSDISDVIAMSLRSNSNRDTGTRLQLIPVPRDRDFQRGLKLMFIVLNIDLKGNKLVLHCRTGKW